MNMNIFFERQIHTMAASIDVPKLLRVIFISALRKRQGLAAIVCDAWFEISFIFEKIFSFYYKIYD